MGGGNPSPLDLCLFHRLERDFYHRLVQKLNLDPDNAKWVLSLWLWFESIGHHDFICHVSSYYDSIVIQFIEEGIACLDQIVEYPNPKRDELPLTSTLAKEPIDLSFFDYHRDMAIGGVIHFFQNVADIIFDDSVMEVAVKDADHPASRKVVSSGLIIWPKLREQRSSSSSYNEWEGGFLMRPIFTEKARIVSWTSSATTILPVAVQNLLNPWAEEWSPMKNQLSQDQRSMFITFSKGYPITKKEIIEFFNSRYGKCVELVMIEKAMGGATPMYGRVVFTSASMIAVVLNGHRTAKFMIKGKHLWARIYTPRAAME